MINRLILPAGPPRISREDAVRIRRDYERFSETGLPERLERYLLEQYGLDVSSHYGPRPIKNPFGKAAGQLSLSAYQVQADAEAGLGFVVLKTVIAEDEQGERSMKEWAVKETRMEVGRIVGKETGEPGWNVTWQGRGWHGSFDEYLSFVREALQLGRERGTVVVPSCKYHLPAIGEDFRLDEYRYTTRRLAQVWKEAGEAGPLQLEKDFSPTLAGSDRAAQRPAILRWLREVPTAIRSALPDGNIRLGIKLMNTLFDDEFQLRTVRTLVEEGAAGADYIVYANRLYDSGRPLPAAVKPGRPMADRTSARAICGFCPGCAGWSCKASCRSPCPSCRERATCTLAKWRWNMRCAALRACRCIRCFNCRATPTA